MENCLVYKLDAVVNNPNLPVLETMQQFTLDAITASGNNSMTDDQKCALNHFFYQIGAIGNSGIFAKMKYIFIPMLANSIVAKTLVNYKDNNTFQVQIAQANVLQFSNNGVYTTETGNIMQQLETNCDVATTGISIAVASTTKILSSVTSGSLNAFRNGSGGNVAQYGLNFAASYNNYLVQGNGVRFAKENGYGAIANIVNGSALGLFIGETFNRTNASVEGTNIDITTPYTSRVLFGSKPVGIIMMGTNLTSDETTLLADAIRELVVSYNS